MTGLGKFFHNLRLENHEKSKEMAKKLGVTPAFLSAVINGRENCPNSWYAKISKLYNLDSRAQGQLIEHIIYSKDVLKINLKSFSAADCEILQHLAINIDIMSTSDKQKLREIIFKKRA
ncbi:MAG: helix-turn-helix domain-containing protein [Clostridiales bacterium]|jgi:transcriptional regulator with XRE-family HTH domain|nr:helix-turn-helix domain-containing protein [Clostridiales bacterium]